MFKWLGRIFGKLYVGDRVEIVSGVYRISYDNGIKNQFKFGRVVGFFLHLILIESEDRTKEIYVDRINLRYAK